MKNFLNSGAKKETGFTLLEMIISVGIFVLVATASSVLFNQALRAYRYTTSRTAAAREAELAMEWITRSIRPDPTSGNSATILDGGGDVSDIDEITLLPPPYTGNKIYYHRHADGTIQREELSGAVSVREDLLAQHVVLLSFGYYDASNQDTLLNPDNAKTVEIIIETQVNDQNFRLYNVANR